MLKWKHDETNRASFVFKHQSSTLSSSSSATAKIITSHDRESRRLRELLKIATECMVYSSYKLEQFTQSLVFADLYELVVNSTTEDLIESGLVTPSIELNASELLKPTRILENLKRMGNPLIRYKLIFDAKILFAFVLNPSSSDDMIQECVCVRLSQQLHDLLIDIDQDDDRIVLQLFDSQLDFVCAQIAAVHNDWIRRNLAELEYRNVPIERAELEKERVKNRLTDFKLFEHFLQKPEPKDTKSEYFYEYDFNLIESIAGGVGSDKLRFDELLDEALACKNLNALETKLVERLSVSASSRQFRKIVDTLRKIILNPVESRLVDLSDSSPVSLVVDSRYCKIFTLVFAARTQLAFSVCPDSFEFYSGKLIASAEKVRLGEIQLERAKKQVILIYRS